MTREEAIEDLEARKAEKIGKLARYLTMVDPLEEPNESPAD